MAHIDRPPLLTPPNREAHKQSFKPISRFAHVLQLIYVRNSSTIPLARSKKIPKDYTVPSTLRACAVYRKSSTISRMTVGNGNLSVLDCSLDWQVKGKASIRLMKMQTTLTSLCCAFCIILPPHLLLTMTVSYTWTIPFKKPVPYRNPAHHTVLKQCNVLKSARHSGNLP